MALLFVVESDVDVDQVQVSAHFTIWHNALSILCPILCGEP
jgi:hypothetical protein